MNGPPKALRKKTCLSWKLAGPRQSVNSIQCRTRLIKWEHSIVRLSSWQASVSLSPRHWVPTRHTPSSSSNSVWQPFAHSSCDGAKDWRAQHDKERHGWSTVTRAACSAKSWLQCSSCWNPVSQQSSISSPTNERNHPTCLHVVAVVMKGDEKPMVYCGVGMTVDGNACTFPFVFPLLPFCFFRITMPLPHSLLWKS